MVRSIPAGGLPATTGRLQGIDPRVPRFSQAWTGALLLGAFAMAGSWPPVVWAVPVLAVILGMGAAFGPRFNFWGLLFRHVVMRIFKLGPPTARKDPAPPRFAMVLGTGFLGAATFPLLLATGLLYWIGWGFVLVVAALALLAAVTNLCVGCEVYNGLLKWKARSSSARGACSSHPARR